MEVIIYLIVIVFFSSLINSTFGFGFALLSMPLLSLVFKLDLLGPLIPLFFMVGSCFIVFRSRQELQFKSILPLIVSTTLMVPLGVYVGKYAPETIIKIILGIFIICFSIYNLSSTKLPFLRNDKWGLLFGALSGFFAGAYNIPGPPAIIYGTLRQWSPQMFRATLQAYFLYITLLIIGNHLYLGSYQHPLIGSYFLYACPAMLLAVPLGKKINNSIPNPKVFNKYVYILMLGSGTLLIIKAFHLI